MVVTFSGIYLFLNEEITWKLDIKFSHFAWTFFYTEDLLIYIFLNLLLLSCNVHFLHSVFVCVEMEIKSVQIEDENEN